MESEEAATALQRSWRKVSSTHDLQALTEQGDPTAQTPNRRRSLEIGALLLCLAAGALLLEGYLLVSKLLPRSSNRWLAAAHDDWYYSFLIPLSAPVAAAAVAVNWFCLKLFKHNS